MAVVDLGLPDFDGIAVVGMLEREGSATRVVIVSASEDGPTIYRAFAHGARAYIPKVSSGDLLCSTLLRVATGESVIPPSIQSALTRELRVRRDRTDEPLLTARELEILRMCADGLTSAAIAEELFVSVPDRQDAPAAHLCQAGGLRPRGSGRAGPAPRPPHLIRGSG